MAKAQKESAFAPLSDFETNLANFVVKRPDLFGTVEDEVSCVKIIKKKNYCYYYYY
jgi:splicing factor 3A subunit 1